MRVIFLDIDGVLNTTTAATHIRLDSHLVDRLRQLVEDADAHIVLSTFWRHFQEYIQYVLQRHNIDSSRLIGITPGDRISGDAFDDTNYANRAAEIRAWLEAHPEVQQFVILDDRESASDATLCPNFIHTDVATGLTEENVRVATQILTTPATVACVADSSPAAAEADSLSKSQATSAVLSISQDTLLKVLAAVGPYLNKAALCCCEMRARVSKLPRELLQITQEQLTTFGQTPSPWIFSGDAFCTVRLSGFDAAGAAALSAVISSSNFTSLDFGGSQIGAEGAAALAAVLTDSSLTSLNLAFNRIGAEGAAALAAVLADSSLTSLNLSYGNGIGPAGAAALGTALGGSTLTSLNLSSNGIGNEGAAALGTALGDSLLSCLVLGCNGIGPDGAAALLAALGGSALTNLNIRSNDIGTEGAVALGKALPGSSLTHLDVSWNQIGDEGADALGAALAGSALTSLKINENGIGKRKTATLKDLIRLQGIQVID